MEPSSALRTTAAARATWLQIEVAWDNGRTLMLVSPPDQFEIVK